MSRFGCLTPFGIAAAALVVLATAVAGYTGGGQMFSPGPLSAVNLGAAQLGGAQLGDVSSHAEIGGDCAACHPEPWSRQTLARRCLDCHFDVANQIGDPTRLHGVIPEAMDCRRCHTEHHGPTGELTRVNLQDLPHEQFGFALDAHATTAEGQPFSCHDCHTSSLARFAEARCLECHGEYQKAFTDWHVVSYGQACRDCHDGVDRFSEGNFDHNTLGFTLTGRHAEVVCSECHREVRVLADFRSGATGCVECHRDDDAHRADLGADCAACHTTAGWDQVTFNHDQAAFKLTGAHIDVACEGCHVDRVFRGTPQNCADCHPDPEVHRGRFGTDCAACHSTDTWEDATFDHNLAAFKLTGAHVEVDCERCHANQVFRGTPQTCVSCHPDPEAHLGRFGTDCAACHNTDNWEGATFNHNLAAFRLTGAHVDVACEKCHANRVYRGTPQTCLGCHPDPDEHLGRYGTECARCHNTAGWANAKFDHSVAAFKLTGAHVNVGCKQCHAGKAFRHTPQTCVACHPEPDAHRGRYGTECATCHSTTRWDQITFDHNLAAFKLTGAHVRVDCDRCHTGQVFRGTPQTCVSCHPDPEAHRGRFGIDCAACHSTDTWEGAKFDHNLAAFKLTGAHANVSCDRCHANNVYRGTPQTCSACHGEPDVHRGQFGTDCGACHGTDTWQGATFNHTFPLDHGEGGRIPCATCHPGAPDFRSYTCYGCHEHDQAKVAEKHIDHGIGDFGDCIRCHPTGRKEEGEGGEDH